MITETVVAPASAPQSAPQPAAGFGQTVVPPPGSPAYVPAPGTAIVGFDRQYVPQQGTITFDDLVTAANPLQHLPVVGMIYRGATGTTLAPPLAILGSMVVGAATGGPIGVFATIMMNFVQTIASMGPAVPGHVLQATDYPATSEFAMQPTGVGDGVVTYADGSTGIPTWKEGELTNFDMTQGNQSNPDGTDDPESRRALALTAYNRAVQAFGGISGVSA